MKSGAFRKKRVYFSQVSNSALHDRNLSLKAKDLYALIQSYITIPGFTLYKRELEKNCKESDTAFESAWSELKREGYLYQHKMRDSTTGKFCFEYELMDKKKPEKPEKSSNIHTPKTHGVDNPSSGQVGVHNNTDSSNTLSSNIQSTMQQRSNEFAVAEREENESGVTDETADAGQRKAELERFGPELERFVRITYPALFMQYRGYQHPPIKPYQRYRTLQILRDYLHDYTEDVEALEDAAEEFVSDGESDGNILAFANPQVIELRLTRQGM